MPVNGDAVTAAPWRFALVGLAIVALRVERGFTEPVLRPDLTDRVSGREDVTFADLVRLVVPGTACNEAIDVRKIGSEAVEDLEPASAAPPRLFRVRSVCGRWRNVAKRVAKSGTKGELAHDMMH